MTSLLRLQMYLRNRFRSRNCTCVSLSELEAVFGDIVYSYMQWPDMRCDYHAFGTSDGIFYYPK